MLDETVEYYDEKVMSTSELLQSLSLRAVRRIAELMDNAQSERTRLAAAIDLADRGQETSKIHKSASIQATLAPEDANALAKALASASTARDTYAHFAQGEHVAKEAQIDALTRLDQEG